MALWLARDSERLNSEKPKITAIGMKYLPYSPSITSDPIGVATTNMMKTSEAMEMIAVHVRARLGALQLTRLSRSKDMAAIMASSNENQR